MIRGPITGCPPTMFRCSTEVRITRSRGVAHLLVSNVGLAPSGIHGQPNASVGGAPSLSLIGLQVGVQLGGSPGPCIDPRALEVVVEDPLDVASTGDPVLTVAMAAVVAGISGRLQDVQVRLKGLCRRTAK